MEITVEEKNLLKANRLAQYRQQIFILQMDVTALIAIGDTVQADATAQVMADVQKAHDAVELL
jgi:hypothetical protein